MKNSPKDPLGILSEDQVVNDPLGILSGEKKKVSSSVSSTPSQTPTTPLEPLSESSVLFQKANERQAPSFSFKLPKPAPIKDAGTKKPQDLRKVDTTLPSDALNSNVSPETEAQFEEGFAERVAIEAPLKASTYLGTRLDEKKEGDYGKLAVEDYIDFLYNQGKEDEAESLKNKYNAIKEKEVKDEGDERYLRDIETLALGKRLDKQRLPVLQLQKEIENLQALSPTPETEAQLEDLFAQYGEVRERYDNLRDDAGNNYYKYDLPRIQDNEARDKQLARGEDEWAITTFGKAATRAVGQGMLDIAQVPKVLGDLLGDTDYDWADRLYDTIDDVERGTEGTLGKPMAKEGGKLRASTELAQLAGDVGGSIALFATGGGLGGRVAGEAGKRAGTFATAFLTSEGDLYDEALKSGMGSQDAAAAATFIGLVTAMAETAIPDVKYFEPSAFRKSVIQSFKKGLSAKDALREAVKALPESTKTYLKSGIKEAGEEVLGQASGDVAKESINAIGGEKYFEDTFNPEEYAMAALGGFMGGAGMSVFSRPKSPTGKAMFREAVENADELLPTIEDPNVAARLLEAKEDLEAMKTHSNWDNMPEDVQDEALDLVERIKQIESDKKEIESIRITDKAKEEEIKSLEDEVNALFEAEYEAKQTEDQATSTDTEAANDTEAEEPERTQAAATEAIVPIVEDTQTGIETVVSEETTPEGVQPTVVDLEGKTVVGETIEPIISVETQAEESPVFNEKNGTNDAAPLQAEYESIKQIKSLKVREKETRKFVDRNFDSIVSQLILKNKITRKCK